MSRPHGKPIWANECRIVTMIAEALVCVQMLDRHCDGRLAEANAGVQAAIACRVGVASVKSSGLCL